MIALLAQCAYLSETSRMIELYRALTARGATVRVATHGGVHRSLLTAAGIPYDVIGPPMSDERGARFVADAPGLGNVRQSMYTDAELRAYVLAEAGWLKGHDARCAVTGFLLTAQLSTRLAGIPLVTTHTGSWVPPVWERRLLPADPPWPALRLLPEPVLRRLVNAAPPRVRYYTAGFNRVAADLGVERIPSLAALVLGDLTLVTEVPEVLGVPAEELSAWRGGRGYRPGTRLAYSGPLYARLDVPVPPHVEEFLNRPGPVVYVALTSSSPELVRRVAVAASEAARVLVAGTVHAVGGLHSGRICVAGVLPSHLVMPRVDLAVTTAGQGSVQTAMAAGTPLLAVPLQPEQTLNAVLVEKLGAARRLAPTSPTTAAALVRQMLGDDGYRHAAKRVQGWYDAVDGAGVAADRIIATADA